MVVNKTEAQTANSTLYAPRRNRECRVILEDDTTGCFRMTKFNFKEMAYKGILRDTLPAC